MTTIAEKLVLLNNTKTEIHNAIETMGVDVAVNLPFSGYPEKILQINTGGAADAWTAPADWIDISSVNNNEINLLVTEGTGIAFSVVTASGTYSIDWGDGTVELNRVSGTIYQHQHLINGTPCTLGYNTWKIRIYGATSDITRWKIERSTFTKRPQQQPILSAVFGTLGITDYSYAFTAITGVQGYCMLLHYCSIPTFMNCTSTQGMFGNCYSLRKVDIPDSWGAVTNVSNMFFGCRSISSTCVTLPSSWGNVLSSFYMFGGCFGIETVILPNNWGSITDCSSMFFDCRALSKITLPISWGNITSVKYMFSNCTSLWYVPLPSSWSNVLDAEQVFYYCQSLVHIYFSDWGSLHKTRYMFAGCISLSSVVLPSVFGDVTDAGSMFSGCYSLKTIINIEYLGSLTSQCDMSNIFTECEFVQQNIVINSLIKKIDFYTYTPADPLKVTSIRLPNSGSLFLAPYNPAINIKSTSLGAVALNLLFGDLPVLSGKTIDITGCPGSGGCNRSIATAKGWTVTG